MVPIYKHKEDVQSCTNYHGIKLLSHTMKLWERVIEGKLRGVTSISENQFGFMPDRSTIEAIYLIRRLMEKYRERQKDLHMVFIDLEKAYDSVSREVIWGCLAEKRILPMFVSVLQDMYLRSRTCVRTPVGDTHYFPVEIGLHQGSALSPLLFALILDVVTRDVQDGAPWCMFFVDDIVLMAESQRELNTKLEQWRAALDTKGLRVSRSKTEYLCSNFSGVTTAEDDFVTIAGDRVPQTDSFRYLGFFIHKGGDIDADVTHRIQAGWLRWRAATRVLCDKHVPLRLKGKFYRAAVRPAILYGSECWPLRKVHRRKLEKAEMRMLRWICGCIMWDQILNDTF